MKEGKEFVLHHEDFLNIREPERFIPSDEKDARKFDAIFISPPWGGTGYQKMQTYSLDHIFPDFDDILTKSIEISTNMVLFLPKNTSIDELLTRLESYPKLWTNGCLNIEFEQLNFGNATKVLLVSIGDIANISAQDV